MKKAIREPEQLSTEEEKGSEVKECLVILTSIEKADESNPAEIIKGLADNVRDISSQVNCKKIVLYPYAHLSAELASPQEISVNQ